MQGRGRYDGIRRSHVWVRRVPCVFSVWNVFSIQNVFRTIYNTHRYMCVHTQTHTHTNKHTHTHTGAVPISRRRRKRARALKIPQILKWARSRSNP
jgi:hypothetical protein